jgi:hypothetical protein
VRGIDDLVALRIRRVPYLADQALEGLPRAAMLLGVLGCAVDGDIFDLALAGQVAIIESIEQDYENNVHLAVVLEDDPGRDLGMLRQPGHRFFFTPEEVVPLLPGEFSEVEE